MRPSGCRTVTARRPGRGQATTSRVVRPLPYRPYRRAHQVMTSWRGLQASRYMRGWRARRTNARSERGCGSYITRPAVSTEGLSLTAQGNVRYRLKTPLLRVNQGENARQRRTVMAPRRWCSNIWNSRSTSLYCAPAEAACGCPNRQSCRFVMARLAALVPTPRVNLTRYHGAMRMNWRAESPAA